MMLLQQLFRFFSVGAMAAVADFGTYGLLTRFVPFFYAYYLPTSVASSFLGASVAYVLHHVWTFRHPSGLSINRYGKFLAVYGFGILWQNILLAIFVETLHIYDLAAKLLAIFIVALCWNFLFAKKWVFRYTLDT